jgi:hypothetical protein
MIGFNWFKLSPPEYGTFEKNISNRNYTKYEQTTAGNPAATIHKI